MTYLLFIAYLVGHALGDGPLQTGAMSRAKRQSAHALVVHASVHALIVTMITAVALGYGLPMVPGGRIADMAFMIGLAELMAHAAIDHEKCRKVIGTYTDQALHIACKLAYTALVWLICSSINA